MKNRYLLSALSVWGSLLVQVLWVKVVCMVFFCIYYRKQNKQFLVCTILLCILCNIHWYNIREQSVPISGFYKIMEIEKSYVVASNKNLKVLVYGLKEPNFDTVLMLNDEFQKIDSQRNENSFVFSDWLAKKGIYYSIYVKEQPQSKNANSIKSKIYKKVISHQHADFLKQILYGIKSEDSSHMLLAIGAHITFFVSVIKKLCERFMRENTVQWLCFIVIIFIGKVFVFSDSILRILCFHFVNIACKHYDTKDRLGISMLVLLCMIPYACGEIFFVLPVCFRLLYIFKQDKISKLAISFFIMFPFQLFYFQSFDLLQWLFYRFLRIGYGLIFCFALCMVWFPIPYSCISFFVEIFQKLESINLIFYGGVCDIWLMLWIYYVFHYITFFHQKDLFYIGICVMYFFISPYIYPFAQVYILDVGQGDCSVIITPFKQEVIMIDVMGHKTRNIPQESIIPFLRAKQIFHIDKVIITHQDLDHSGGLKQLQEYISIGTIIDTKQKAKFKQENWMKFLLLDYEGEDENENSIVTFFQLHNIRFLFMGDLGSEQETLILQQYPNLQAEVLKVGHHGSNTSSSLSFIHQIHPMLATISSGRNNYYGHPHQEVLERLQNEKVLMMNTAQHGYISIQTSRYMTIIRNGRNEIGILFHI